ncbi:hypothetical protein [Myroides odoratimimus]|uniref:hypothetical protein n=1 Tax=Myroides odoratimimus TaxID=76832 RepID=UPI001CE1639F|nr:hypothetical protein [Myroides odoratimimus]MCA4807319.1 hypothetical protein [Myroides odoratimimus]
MEKKKEDLMRKEIEDQIRKKIAKEQEELFLEQKVKRYQDSILDTIHFIKEQRDKAIENNHQLSTNKKFNNNFFQYLKEEDLEKMYLNFSNEGIICKSMTFEGFKTKLKESDLKTRLNGPSLYYLHQKFEEYYEGKLPIKKITLKSFITNFKNKNGESFVYGTLRNGKKQLYPLHKELFDEMFIN